MPAPDTGKRKKMGVPTPKMPNQLLEQATQFNVAAKQAGKTTGGIQYQGQAYQAQTSNIAQAGAQLFEAGLDGLRFYKQVQTSNINDERKKINGVLQDMIKEGKTDQEIADWADTIELEYKDPDQNGTWLTEFQNKRTGLSMDQRFKKDMLDLSSKLDQFSPQERKDALLDLQRKYPERYQSKFDPALEAANMQIQENSLAIRQTAWLEDMRYNLWAGAFSDDPEERERFWIEMSNGSAMVPEGEMGPTIEAPMPGIYGEIMAGNYDAIRPFIEEQMEASLHGSVVDPSKLVPAVNQMTQNVIESAKAFRAYKRQTNQAVSMDTAHKQAASVSTPEGAQIALNAQPTFFTEGGGMDRLEYGAQAASHMETVLSNAYKDLTPAQWAEEQKKHATISETRNGSVPSKLEVIDRVQEEWVVGLVEAANNNPSGPEALHLRRLGMKFDDSTGTPLDGKDESPDFYIWLESTNDAIQSEAAQGLLQQQIERANDHIKNSDVEGAFGDLLTTLQENGFSASLRATIDEEIQNVDQRRALHDQLDSFETSQREGYDQIIEADLMKFIHSQIPKYENDPVALEAAVMDHARSGMNDRLTKAMGVSANLATALQKSEQAILGRVNDTVESLYGVAGVAKQVAEAREARDKVINEANSTKRDQATTVALFGVKNGQEDIGAAMPDLPVGYRVQAGALQSVVDRLGFSDLAGLEGQEFEAAAANRVASLAPLYRGVANPQETIASDMQVVSNFIANRDQYQGQNGGQKFYEEVYSQLSQTMQDAFPMTYDEEGTIVPRIYSEGASYADIPPLRVLTITQQMRAEIDALPPTDTKTRNSLIAHEAAMLGDAALRCEALLEKGGNYTAEEAQQLQSTMLALTVHAQGQVDGNNTSKRIMSTALENHKGSLILQAGTLLAVAAPEEATMQVIAASGSDLTANIQDNLVSFQSMVRGLSGLNWAEGGGGSERVAAARNFRDKAGQRFIDYAGWQQGHLTKEQTDQDAVFPSRYRDSEGNWVGEFPGGRGDLAFQFCDLLTYMGGGPSAFAKESGALHTHTIKNGQTYLDSATGNYVNHETVRTHSHKVLTPKWVLDNVISGNSALEPYVSGLRIELAGGAAGAEAHGHGNPIQHLRDQGWGDHSILRACLLNGIFSSREATTAFNQALGCAHLTNDMGLGEKRWGGAAGLSRFMSLATVSENLNGITIDPNETFSRHSAPDTVARNPYRDYDVRRDQPLGWSRDDAREYNRELNDRRRAAHAEAEGWNEGRGWSVVQAQEDDTLNQTRIRPSFDFGMRLHPANRGHWRGSEWISSPEEVTSSDPLGSNWAGRNHFDTGEYSQTQVMAGATMYGPYRHKDTDGGLLLHTLGNELGEGQEREARRALTIYSEAIGSLQKPETLRTEEDIARIEKFVEYTSQFADEEMTEEETRQWALSQGTIPTNTAWTSENEVQTLAAVFGANRFLIATGLGGNEKLDVIWQTNEEGWDFRGPRYRVDFDVSHMAMNDLTRGTTPSRKETIPHLVIPNPANTTNQQLSPILLQGSTRFIDVERFSNVATFRGQGLTRYTEPTVPTEEPTEEPTPIPTDLEENGDNQ